MDTYCEECGTDIVLVNWDHDGTLVGAECICGYYVTRYANEEDED